MEIVTKIAPIVLAIIIKRIMKQFILLSQLLGMKHMHLYLMVIFHLLVPILIGIPNLLNIL